MSGEERRRKERASARCLLSYARRLDVSRFASLGVASTLDLSAGGVKFLAHEPIPERTRLELELVLDGRPARVDAARVVRVTGRDDGTFEVAARFDQTSNASREIIKTYVEERLARRSAA